MQQRNAATLLPIPLLPIPLLLEQLFHSNEWAAYRRISTLPGIAGLNTVNHSLHFVDPGTGTHTQNIESYWSRAKYKMKGVHAQLTWTNFYGVSSLAAQLTS